MADVGNWRSPLYPEKPNQNKPDCAAALGLLSHLNADELREVLNDDKKFEDMIKDLKEFKEIETEKEMLMASNRSLAEFNLAREPQLSSGKQRIQELSEDGERIYNSVEAKSKELMRKSGHHNVETTLALLQTAAAEIEEESEAIAEKFLDGDLDVEEFLDQFTPRRKLMHLRKVKADKMSEIITKRTSLSSSSSVQPSPGVPARNFGGLGYYHQPASSAVPYPVGAINAMPMPGMFSAPNHFG